MAVRQVHGFVLDELGRVVLQEDEGVCNLPGGTPEPADADLAATLARECAEESQLRHGPPVFVGLTD
ncbi:MULTISPECIES: NUDIX domain-containing protein [Frankia]|uniref:NUDIX domain-containing protein n=1 Tax=Frankia TaxID=1854 RepID=UPI0002FFCA8D|nr:MULTISPECIES: NUDIX domain-containing protein [Frankia]